MVGKTYIMKTVSIRSLEQAKDSNRHITKERYTDGREAHEKMQHQVIRKCTLTLQAHQLSKIKVTVPSVEENEELLEILYIASGNVKCAIALENSHFLKS